MPHEHPFGEAELAHFASDAHLVVNVFEIISSEMFRLLIVVGLRVLNSDDFLAGYVAINKATLGCRFVLGHHVTV